MKQWVLIGAVAAAMVAGPAFADDAAAPGGAPILLVGGPLAPAADDTKAADGSFLASFMRYLAAARIRLGGSPGDDAAAGASGSPANTFAEVGLGGFTLGGRYSRWSESDPLRTDSQSFGVGASYSLDSWSIGVDWSHGNYDEVFLDVGDGSDADVYAFTTSYALRPGVRISGLLEYSDGKSAQSGSNAGAFAVGIGTLINF